ncbi:MAG: hypothetical protein ACRDPS_09990 [Nocardioides sp.]|uniref:hypothetical protein n=1 Tax=Nocardioides sp. TaxID=35761 RepID=UPI003D6BAC6C
MPADLYLVWFVIMAVAINVIIYIGVSATYFGEKRRAEKRLAEKRRAYVDEGASDAAGLRPAARRNGDGGVRMVASSRSTT